MSTPRSRINLTVDRLLLRGFPREQWDAISRNLTVELRAQLSQITHPNALGASRALPLLRIETFTFRETQGSATRIASQAARRIVGGIRS